MTLHRWVVAKRLKAPELRIRNGRAVRLWSKADLDRTRQPQAGNLLQRPWEEERLQEKVKKRDALVLQHRTRP